jgi:hypothetical protein
MIVVLDENRMTSSNEDSSGDRFSSPRAMSFPASATMRSYSLDSIRVHSCSFVAKNSFNLTAERPYFPPPPGSVGNGAGGVEMRPCITSSIDTLWPCSVKPMARSNCAFAFAYVPREETSVDRDCAT